MGSVYFNNWDYNLNGAFIDDIISFVLNENTGSVGSLGISDYFQGIEMYSNAENGIYIFYFSDGSFYVGVAASCTLLERLAKHLDGRASGSFNTLLKSIGKDPKDSEYFDKNQRFFLEAKILFLPIKTSRLKVKRTDFTKRKQAIQQLEQDIIYLLSKKGKCLRNSRIPAKLSGVFDYPDTLLETR